MNHPVCETPGWQFIAGSGFKSRPHRMSMRTSRLFCRDVAIPYFITENIFFSLRSYNFAFLFPEWNCGIAIKTWRMRTKWLHHAMHKTVQETFKSETFYFYLYLCRIYLYLFVLCFYLCRSDGSCDGRLHKNGKHRGKYNFTCFSELATACCTTEHHVTIAGK